jgi:small subunit ribosomal protein S13
MARISGVDLPPSKQVEIGLTYIFGIGRTRAKQILDKASVDPTLKVRDLSDDDTRRIQRVINQEGRVEGDLRKAVSLDIKRLIEIGSYRGMRHRRNLPVRGQRTHTNARTRRGPRRTVAGKRHKLGKKG